MIPKIIHYVWFGGNPKSGLVESCIASWKKYMPDYEIIEWNESNFDVNLYAYTKEAFKSKKWAFIADFIRLWAVKEYGGLYLDSDVEVVKSFDSLMAQEAFICFEHCASESNPILEASVIGSVKNGVWISKAFDEFKDKHFLVDGKYDITPLPYPLASITKKAYSELKFNNTVQQFDGITIYTRDFFSPYYGASNFLDLTANTYAIHHFSGTWHFKEFSILRGYQKKLGRKIGKFVFIFRHPFMSMRIRKFHRTFISREAEYCHG